jgi:REP element-mobilizing transposase RayT
MRSQNMTDHNWDDNAVPLAYLITFRTYGTWLHGDKRYSMDRHGKNIYGTPKVLPSRNLNRLMDENQASGAFLLDGPRRGVVESAIRSVCSFRGYGLLAINIRTNHAHSVVAAPEKPEVLINAFKSNATRELRAAGLVGGGQQVWSRGGSRRYLWKPNHVEGAVNYVLYGQGDDLPNF